MTRRACLVTFGCQMNRLDSELVRSLLEEAGWVMTDREDDADLILYNTCSVRENAENRVWGRLGSLKRTKRDRPGVLIAVLGCMAQKDREHIFEVAPHVDVVCGTREFPDLLEYLARAETTGEHQLAVDMSRTLGDVHSRRRLAPGQFHAYVSVMRGCDSFCSYCVVPYVRGRVVSRPVAQIVDEVKRLRDGGVVEVTLLGQNISAYGKDLDAANPGSSEDRAGVATLLRRVSVVEGILRVWFITGHPRDTTRDVFEAMRDCPNVCEYLHMPAQSGSTRILERMNRGYTRERYLDLVREAKEIVPGLGIASDFIAGFPGETDDDFRETVSLVEACRFSVMFAFKYSPRPGTKAASLADDVPWEVKQSRNRELLAVQMRIASEENARFVGRSVEVLVEGPSKTRPERLSGRARDHRIVIIEKKGSDLLCGNVPRPSTGGPDILVRHGLQGKSWRAGMPAPPGLPENGSDPISAGRVVPVTITRSTALSLYGQLASADTPSPSGRGSG